MTAIDIGEQFADGKANGEELARAVLLAREIDTQHTNSSAETHALAVLVGVVANTPEWNKHRLGRILQVHRNAESRGMLCGLVRDIFGNPFRPVTLDPSWQTSTVVALAKQMYESRDFSPMPILADALQDAGCEHADILDHCRGPGPHARGCWVVDLVLGLS